MPKPPGLSFDGYWEYYRNRAALHEHEAGDTTSTNSRYTLRTHNNFISAPPKDQANPSHTEVNIKPLVAPSEKKLDLPGVDNFNNKARRIADDIYGYSSDNDDDPTPEVSEDSSSDTEDEGEGSNEVQGPPLIEPKNSSHEDDDDDTSEPKAKRKLLF